MRAALRAELAKCEAISVERDVALAALKVALPGSLSWEAAMKEAERLAFEANSAAFQMVGAVKFCLEGK
jgi:hypothetical protein